ncbi:CPBP family intramembrane metalloprotease [Alloacidobacterium dinghuense]|uniref:CPBP family intramembrane metalloprotease n=1 Tax=Alloacidobacterium dinghuense TaxID=2763107 RepID=A0A7G8BN05_9BACT|nr:type II CAAX endopeptidase family protein [Alloacidobacterium dinghuense]QNI33925.1 CPBP family intramembrane metalloprotease [Alloacidobacterium dinghuense]
MKAAGRLRSFSWFAIAAFYFVFAQQISLRAANGLSSGDSFLLVQSIILLFLLLVGYAAMGYAGQSQREPLKTMGLARREGWKREFALGAALGWGGVVACVLPMALIGSLVIRFWTNGHQFFVFLMSLLTLAVAALAEEVAFRGYAFQRLIDAIGPTLATLGMSVLFAVMHLTNTNASAASTLVTILAGWMFSIAYLRTRALWLPWGLHFAWNASMGLLFGLPVSGLTVFNPVITTNALGPLWLTGGRYGPEGSAIAVFVLPVLTIILVKVTRDYAHRYAQPVIVPGGIPVDLDAVARRQHEAAMGIQSPSEPQLVQILPAFGSSNGTMTQIAETKADGEPAPEVPKEDSGIAS